MDEQGTNQMSDTKKAISELFESRAKKACFISEVRCYRGRGLGLMRSSWHSVIWKRRGWLLSAIISAPIRTLTVSTSGSLLSSIEP